VKESFLHPAKSLPADWPFWAGLSHALNQEYPGPCG
jgi:hypothetical protein